jgi:hypothetical protein
VRSILMADILLRFNINAELADPRSMRQSPIRLGEGAERFESRQAVVTPEGSRRWGRSSPAAAGK